ncbi:uncharacterized protein BJX67DRAFT_98172 [Aspergillus lucknowensis]|uniref:Uncharacterized protein n=1 Tax=Aspergillus lucknowensis TaxID=176173 RepID=A0ABR4M645_9EURO
MRSPSKIGLAVLAFVSAVRVATAAPALGFGNHTDINNQTFVILPHGTCTQDSQCEVGSFCDLPTGKCSSGCRADLHCAQGQ